MAFASLSMRGQAMKPLVRTLFIFSFCLFLLGCGSGSGNADPPRISGNLKSGGHQEACKVLRDYADRIEQIYLQYDWVEIEKMLPEAEAHYRNQMSKLDEAGKWTPRQKIRKSIELPFLLGRFHGVLQSCKIERMRGEESTVGCDRARNLKEEILKLCSE